MVGKAGNWVFAFVSSPSTDYRAGCRLPDTRLSDVTIRPFGNLQSDGRSGLIRYRTDERR